MILLVVLGLGPLIVAITLWICAYAIDRDNRDFEKNKQFGKAVVTSYNRVSQSDAYTLYVRMPELSDKNTYSCSHGKINVGDYPPGKIVDVMYVPKKMAGINYADIRLIDSPPANRSGFARVLKIISIFIISIILLTYVVYGCINFDLTKGDDKNEIEQYLSTKYTGDFTYISDCNDVWSSKTKTYVYSDKKGNHFNVKNTDGVYIDNYCSVLFDDITNKSISNKFDFKLFINTESTFFGSTDKFENYSTYLTECPVVDICVYTAKSDEYDEIANMLLKQFKDCTASVMIYVVSDRTYDNVDRYGDSTEVLSSQSFWIEDKMISSKSWKTLNK